MREFPFEALLFFRKIFDFDVYVLDRDEFWLMSLICLEVVLIGVAFTVFVRREFVYRHASFPVFDFIKAVKCRDTVPFGVCWVIEDLIDKIIDLCVKALGYLPDVDHLCGASADYMDS